MLSDTDHRKGPLPKFWVCKPETTQNLTSTNICIFAVFCVCRRSRLMTNSKRDLIRGQKHSQPMEQGVGTSLDPLRLPRLLAEPLGVPSGPPQTAGNAHKRDHSSGGGEGGGQRQPPSQPVGLFCQRRRGAQTTGMCALNHLGDRGYGSQVFSHISAAAPLQWTRLSCEGLRHLNRREHLGPPAAAFPRSP